MRNLFAIALVVLITGCAHPININPELSSLRVNKTTQSDNNVGYFISQEDLTTEVTTNGGGGDDVKYFPYKDTEAALKTILSSKFNKVYTLKSQQDDPLIKDKNIKYIFTPKIKTESSSSSMLTWPPTDFSVELTCVAYDDSGQNIWKKTVSGQGHAEFSEFKTDFSLSAKRASEKAFALMRDEILKAGTLK